MRIQMRLRRAAPVAAAAFVSRWRSAALVSAHADPCKPGYSHGRGPPDGVAGMIPGASQCFVVSAMLALGHFGAAKPGKARRGPPRHPRGAPPQRPFGHFHQVFHRPRTRVMPLGDDRPAVGFFVVPSGLRLLRRQINNGVEFLRRERARAGHQSYVRARWQTSPPRREGTRLVPRGRGGGAVDRGASLETPYRPSPGVRGVQRETPAGAQSPLDNYRPGLRSSSYPGKTGDYADAREGVTFRGPRRRPR